MDFKYTRIWHFVQFYQKFELISLKKKFFFQNSDTDISGRRDILGDRKK